VVGVMTGAAVGGTRVGAEVGAAVGAGVLQAADNIAITRVKTSNFGFMKISSLK